MRFTIVLVLALAVTAQDHRYSSTPGAAGGKSKGGMRVKNAIDFTPDGLFLQRAAVDNAFILEFCIWAKNHGASGGVRSTSIDVSLLESKFGDELRRLASRKRITVVEKPNDRDVSTKGHIDAVYAGSTDDSFVEQMLRRYDQEIVSFERESLSPGSDPDIKSFAADGIAILQRHRSLIEALRPK